MLFRLMLFRTVSIQFLFIFCFFPLFIAGAKAQPLTIYTYQSFNSEYGPGQNLQKQFESQTNCQIKWVESEDAVALLNRLKREGAKTQADVILGLDTQLQSSAQQADLVQPHQLNSLQIKALNSELTKNEIDTFIPIDYGYLTLIYNADKIKTPPKTWGAFLEDKSTLIYPDPRTSSTGLALLLWIKALFGDNEAEIWKKVAQKTITVPNNWNEAYHLFLQGESDFVLSYHTSPIVHQLYDNDDRYQAVFFEEGLYEQVEVAAIAKNAAHFECAQAFLAFLLTEEAQHEIAIKNIMLPATNITLPPAFQTLKTPTKTHFLTQTPAQLKQNLKLWRNWVTQ